MDEKRTIAMNISDFLEKYWKPLIEDIYKEGIILSTGDLHFNKAVRSYK